MANKANYNEVLEGSAISVVTVVPVLTSHALYVANDYVGTDHVPMTFTVARVLGGAGAVLEAVLIDYAAQSVAAELWLFDTTLDTPHDSAPWTLSDAEAATCIGVIPFTTYYADALNVVSMGGNPNPLGFKCGAASQAIFGCLVTRGAPTYAAGDLTVRLKVLRF